MNNIVYCNGALIPRQEAKLSAFDYGFLYGYGIFETMRAYNGTVFRLDTHMERLERSAGQLSIDVDIPVLKKAVQDTIDANELTSARVRLTVSAGEGSMVPDLNSCESPTVLITAADYTPFPEERYEKGFSLVTSNIHRNSGSPVLLMKTTNYMESLLARHHAKAAGYDEALLLNESGMIAEAATSNLFLVKDNVIVTPNLDSGILPGITRYTVAELSQALDLEFMFAAIPAETAFEADELFITNSIMEIMPVTELDDETIGNGTPGPVTETLRKAYRDLVKRETSK